MTNTRILLARSTSWSRRSGCDGSLHCHEDIVHRIERAPAALICMMKGEAIGKRLVQVAAA
jgi:NADPH-dependent curcumin reductase CurA